MLRVFQNEITDPKRFVVTLELVPGRESKGRSVDTVMGIAKDAFSDGRVSAVSITDNPGGNPSLSPDAIGYRIFSIGMDVIVHFTCRDMNRVGMESRALQLAMMGMKNILALSGDYSGKGFGGQGAPVFDLDSVQLQILLDLAADLEAEAVLLGSLAPELPGLQRRVAARLDVEDALTLLQLDAHVGQSALRFTDGDLDRRAFADAGKRGLQFDLHIRQTELKAHGHNQIRCGGSILSNASRTPG